LLNDLITSLRRKGKGPREHFTWKRRKKRHGTAEDHQEKEGGIPQKMETMPENFSNSTSRSMISKKRLQKRKEGLNKE